MKKRKTLTILGAIVASSLLATGCGKSDSGKQKSSGSSYSKASPSSPGMSSRYNKYNNGSMNNGSMKKNYRSPREREMMNSENARGGMSGMTSHKPDSEFSAMMSGKAERPGISEMFAGKSPASEKPASCHKRYRHPLNVERVTGEITDYKVHQNPDGTTYVMVKLGTDSENMKVLLGPACYLDRSNISLEVGDKIEVKGSRMEVNGDEMMIASEVNKNGRVIELRSENGRCRW